MQGVLGCLVVGAVLLVLLRSRRRHRPAPHPVYNLWDPPKRPKLVRMKHRRWYGDDLLRELAAAWSEEQKK